MNNSNITKLSQISKSFGQFLNESKKREKALFQEKEQKPLNQDNDASIDNLPELVTLENGMVVSKVGCTNDGEYGASYCEYKGPNNELFRVFNYSNGLEMIKESISSDPFVFPFEYCFKEFKDMSLSTAKTIATALLTGKVSSQDLSQLIKDEFDLDQVAEAIQNEDGFGLILPTYDGKEYWTSDPAFRDLFIIRVE